MPTVALEERIEQELSSNPTLELAEPTPEGDLTAQQLKEERSQQDRDSSEGERELLVQPESADSNHADDFERLSNLSDEYGETWEGNTYESGEGYRSAVVNAGERDKKLDAMANTAARSLSLSDQLRAQWNLVETQPDVLTAGEYLIDFLDDDGYLRTERQTLLDQAPYGITADHLDQALQEIQRALEPAGLGARDLRECLLLQIDAKIRWLREANGLDEVADLQIDRMLVKDYLKDIEVNRLPRIAKSTGLSLDRIKQAILNLRQFPPHPGRLLVDDRPCAVTPDAVVEFDDQQNCYIAYLTHDRIPSIRINSRYQKMARDKKTAKDARRFINDNLQSAQWLVEAIEQRKSTLLRVINVVVEAQRDYFDQGLQQLKPLPMTLVADQLGIHVATVSRAVSEKYLQTPQGIVPLRMFFSGGTATDDGDQMSWRAIQAKLEQLINEEDKCKPLSDDLLVDKLKENGIEIARRTVAKYRKQLNILPARQRREY